jgi:hypothetical protein
MAVLGGWTVAHDRDSPVTQIPDGMAGDGEAAHGLAEEVYIFIFIYM